MASLVGDTHLDHCHSVHHQGIGELGAGLVPIGYAEDGQLEAVELRASRGWSACSGTRKSTARASPSSRRSTTSSSAEQACTDP